MQKKWLLICRESHDSIRRGGIASANRSHIQMLNAQNIFVEEVCAHESGENIVDYSSLHRRVALHFRDYSLSRKKWRKILRLVLFLVYRVNVLFYVLKRSRGFDVIEVADYGAEGIFLLMFPKIRSKLVVRGHSISAYRNGRIRVVDLQGILEILQLRYAKRIICCSFNLAETYRNLIGVTAAVIYNPIDVDFGKSEYKNTSNILYVGTVSIAKGADVLFEWSKNFKRSLTVAGRLSNEISLNNYTEYVTYLGMVSNERVLSLMSTHSILIVPSRWENLPMVVVEAMSKGIIVLGANNTGIAELIDDGITGFLYETESIEDLEVKIQRIEQLTKLEIEKIINQAQEFVVKNIGYNEIYKQWKNAVFS